MEPHGLNKSGARGSTAVYATCPLVEPRLQTATLLIEICALAIFLGLNYKDLTPDDTYPFLSIATHFLPRNSTLLVLIRLISRSSFFIIRSFHPARVDLGRLSGEALGHFHTCMVEL